MKAVPGWTDLSGVRTNIILTFNFPFALHVNTQTTFCFHSSGSRAEGPSRRLAKYPIEAFCYGFIKRNNISVLKCRWKTTVIMSRFLTETAS